MIAGPGEVHVAQQDSCTHKVQTNPDSDMQTWEYTPQFVLRTYSYLYPPMVLSTLFTVLLPIQFFASMLVAFTVSQDCMALFILLRAMLADTMGWAEISLLKVISE
jgi:hypothetical protein